MLQTLNWEWVYIYRTQSLSVFIQLNIGQKMIENVWILFLCMFYAALSQSFDIGVILIKYDILDPNLCKIHANTSHDGDLMEHQDTEYSYCKCSGCSTK